MSGTAPETPTPAAAPSSPATASGPGALLRQARERAGIGAEDLAGQLKIAKSTLEALERDDFAALSEPVYVRGYYRKIAKVLGVPESEVVAAYGARSQPAPATPAMRRIPLAGGVAAGTSRQYRGQGLWIAVGIAVVLAIGFALTERKPAQRLAPETVAPAAVAPTTAMPAPTATNTTVMPTTGAETAAAASAGTAVTVTAPPSAGPDVAAAPPPPAAATVPPTQLTLEFSAASFVRVEDNRQRTLAIGLVRGGERQALDGQPPYTVFLGNAQNVKVFYGGGAVDFSSHINRQNDTARFTVP